MKNSLWLLDENISVKQRNMADNQVGLGLIIGGFTGVFVVLGGLAVATAKDNSGEYSYKFFTYGWGLFGWLVVLTAIMTALLVYVYHVTTYLQKLPKQLNDPATVSWYIKIKIWITITTYNFVMRFWKQ
jgi:hypothetical protein